MKSFSTRLLALALCVMCIAAFASPILVHADDLDELGGLSSAPVSNQGQGSTQRGGNQSISDYLHGYNPVTDENMASAGQVASPIVNFIGTASGFVVMIVSAAIFLVTALDLAYIGLPFTRGLLNPAYAAASGGAPAGGMPMGGMGMGMGGMRGMGAMGMGAMGAMGGGAAQPTGEYGLRRKWVSDEAVFCVQAYAMGNQAQPAMGGGMMPGMGGGMMGGGMMGAGMMGAQAQAQQPQTAGKSVILEYLKKRSFFLIIFAIATVVLMSSMFTDCGLNLAELLAKIVGKASDRIVDVDF